MLRYFNLTISIARTEFTGIVRCIEKALAKAGVAREDVNYINAHAPSTQVGDLIEFAALVRCFGNNLGVNKSLNIAA